MISIYDEKSGECKICGADTWYGDEPHKDDCPFEDLLTYKEVYLSGTQLLRENLPNFTPTSLASIWLEAAKRLKELKNVS